jgi:hypothetical protein
MSSRINTNKDIVSIDLTPVLDDIIKVFDKYHLNLIDIFFILDVLRSETIDFMNEELNLNEASKHIFNDQGS